MLLDRAVKTATACSITSGIKFTLSQLQRSPNLLVNSIGLVAATASQMELLLGTDGTCGAAVAYFRAYHEVGKVVNANGGYSPVFIQYSVGTADWTGQRPFTVRVGPNVTQWTGFSGKV